jgi:hypothetical protein
MGCDLFSPHPACLLVNNAGLTGSEPRLCILQCVNLEPEILRVQKTNLFDKDK